MNAPPVDGFTGQDARGDLSKPIDRRSLYAGVDA
jgi:hypothetical protein